jgi:hypothetical protein
MKKKNRRASLFSRAKSVSACLSLARKVSSRRFNPNRSVAGRCEHIDTVSTLRPNR